MTFPDEQSWVEFQAYAQRDEPARYGKRAIEVAQCLLSIPKPHFTSSATAIRFAQFACELPGAGNPEAFCVLAESYATAGQIDDAIRSAERGLTAWNALHGTRIRSALESNLERYRRLQPSHLSVNSDPESPLRP